MSNRLMTLAWKVQGLSGPEKLVLVRLADRANEAGEAYPGQTSLAEDCCLGIRTVRDALGKLVSGGHLVILSRATFDQPAKYQVTPKLAPGAAPDDGAARHTPPAPAAGGSSAAGAAAEAPGDRQEPPDRHLPPERRHTPLPPAPAAGPLRQELPPNPKGTQRNPQGINQTGEGIRVRIAQAASMVVDDAPQTSGVVNANPPVPAPTLPEAVAFGERSGIPKDCTEKWFLTCDARCWTDPQGRPIGRWQSSLLGYAKTWRALSSQARPGSGSTATTPRRAVGPSLNPLDPANLKI